MTKKIITPLKLSHYKSVLCLNSSFECGLMPKLGLPIIAADGAANILVKNSIVPDVIIGDLDSLAPGIILPYAKVIHDPDQDTSDLQKALRFIDDNDLNPSIAFGAVGRQFDHVANNLSSLFKVSALCVESQYFFFSMNENEFTKLRVPEGTKISILGAPEGTVSSKGLKWELKDYEMSFKNGSSSLSNRSAGEDVELSVTKGGVFVVVYICLNMISFQ